MRTNKSQFKSPPSTHVYLRSFRGKFDVEARKDERRGDFLILVNKRIVDRQEKVGSAILSWKFWVLNHEQYKRIYFVQTKEKKTRKMKWISRWKSSKTGSIKTIKVDAEEEMDARWKAKDKLDWTHASWQLVDIRAE